MQPPGTLFFSFFCFLFCKLQYFLELGTNCNFFSKIRVIYTGVAIFALTAAPFQLAPPSPMCFSMEVSWYDSLSDHPFLNFQVKSSISNTDRPPIVSRLKFIQRNKFIDKLKENVDNQKWVDLFDMASIECYITKLTSCITSAAIALCLVSKNSPIFNFAIWKSKGYKKLK